MNLPREALDRINSIVALRLNRNHLNSLYDLRKPRSLENMGFTEIVG
jgi:hypothetical protein